MTRPNIACLGAGRMGRGIAVAFAYAGHPVAIVDFKPRDTGLFEALADDALNEIRKTLVSLSGFGLLTPPDVERIMTRVRVMPETEAAAALADAAVVFEGVPEVLELKRDVLARASRLASSTAIIASTTSTILVDDLSGALQLPRRFLNVHWLN